LPFETKSRRGAGCTGLADSIFTSAGVPQMSTLSPRDGGVASPHAPGANPANSSPLEEERRRFAPAVPHVLLSGEFEVVKGEKTTALGQADAIAERFPQIYGQPFVDLVPAANATGAPPAVPGAPASIVPQPSKHVALRIGCVLSGGQAAGGHSCICGLFDYLKAHAPGSALLGFVGGPAGVMKNAHRILRQETIDRYRSSGGFTMLASGRDKIETEAQFEKAVATAKEARLSFSAGF
jgi:pyrophosphate--fructose-6-phosphate 1-phosphotransferase